MGNAWRRIRRSADTLGWTVALVGAGVIAGILLSIGLVGLPPARQPAIAGPLGLDYLDLIAQRGMNDAAWWMVVITALSSMVGTAGLYLIGRTLQEAKRSADAAMETAATGRIELRAYLLIEYANIGITKSDDLTIKYRVKNSGVTPARDVAFKVSAYVRPTDEKSTEVDLQSITKSRSDVAAGSARDAVAGFDRTQAAGFANEHGDFMFEAIFELSYRDVFNKYHVETSRYGRILSYYELSKEKSLYRDVGRGIRWGD